MYLRIVFLFAILVIAALTYPRSQLEENWHVIFYPNSQIDIRVVETTNSEEQCITRAYELANDIGDTFMRVSDYNCGMNPRKLSGTEPDEPANVVGGYEYDLLTR